MKLLAPIQPAELPADALLVRLRSRRSTFELSDGEAAESPPGEVVSWVYHRLDKRLRKQLSPFLELMAMRSLTLGLRYVLNGEPVPHALMRHTLLAKPLQKLLAATLDSKATIARLEAVLVTDYPFAAGLAATYQNQGPGGVEQQLASGILQHGLNRSGSDVLNVTIRYLIDMRNLLTIRKFWRWQVAQMPPLTEGGAMETVLLKRIWLAHDDDRLVTLAARLAGGPGRFEKAVQMEQGLINGLSRTLRRASRDPLSIAVVIDYLWRSQVAAQNRLLQRILPAERQELLQEVLLL